jgi:hypothetical protein
VINDPVPIMTPASLEQSQRYVLRSQKDKEREREVRRRLPPRWRKRYRWRLHNDRKLRWLCICLMCSTTSLVSLITLWSLGELIAALAVAGTIILLGFGVCLGIELVIHCPNAFEWMLYDLGLITPYQEPIETMVSPSAAVMMEEGDLLYHPGHNNTAYDVEIGEGHDLTFRSPGIQYSSPEEPSKPIYGDIAEQINQPVEKFARAGRLFYHTLRNAWATSMPREAYDDASSSLLDDDDGDPQYYYANGSDEEDFDEYNSELDRLAQGGGETDQHQSITDEDNGNPTTSISEQQQQQQQQSM